MSASLPALIVPRRSPYPSIWAGTVVGGASHRKRFPVAFCHRSEFTVGQLRALFAYHYL